jgi:hypothetical protein
LESQQTFVLMLAVGLGKTLVAVREMLLTPGWSLVVSSKTVQAAWIRQMDEWYPERPFVAVRSQRQFRTKDVERAVQMISDGIEVIVSVTYPQLSRGGVADLERVAHPGMVVVDENSLRNLSTKKVVALNRLKGSASRFLMLTATPYQNSSADLVSLGLLMGCQSFGHCKYAITAGAAQSQIETLVKHMDRFLAHQIYKFFVDKILIVRAAAQPWKVTRRAICSTGEEQLDIPVIRTEAEALLNRIRELNSWLSGKAREGDDREVWRA